MHCELRRAAALPPNSHSPYPTPTGPTLISSLCSLPGFQPLSCPASVLQPDQSSWFSMLSYSSLHVSLVHRAFNCRSEISPPGISLTSHKYKVYRFYHLK